MRESILRSSSSSENRRNSDVEGGGRPKAVIGGGGGGSGNSNGHVVTFAPAATNAKSLHGNSSSPKSGRRNPLRMLSNAIDFRGKRRGGGGGGLRQRTNSEEDAEIRIASAAAAIVSQGRLLFRVSSGFTEASLIDHKTL